MNRHDTFANDDGGTSTSYTVSTNPIGHHQSNQSRTVKLDWPGVPVTELAGIIRKSTIVWQAFRWVLGKANSGRSMSN